MDSSQLVTNFSALGDKTRLKLFGLISGGEICVSELARQLKVSTACVSQHMKVLRQAGLVDRVRSGKRVCYQLNVNSSNKELIDFVQSNNA